VWIAAQVVHQRKLRLDVAALDGGTVNCVAPVFKVIIEFEGSVKKYPNIKVGADFKGYRN
jgi:hypothetical protein